MREIEGTGAIGKNRAGESEKNGALEGDR